MPFAIAGDGTRIHYEVTGLTKRAPVLLVQGLGGEKNSWNLQRAALALRHRTIAFDNRGAGRSDKPDGKYNLEEMADDAIAVLDAAGIENAHVVGLSMGGALTLWLASRHADLSGIVCINPTTKSSASKLAGARLAVKSGKKSLPAIGSDISDPAVKESSYDATPLAAAVSLFAEGLKPLSKTYGSIKVPLLLFTSTNDHVVNPKESDFLASKYAGSIERVVLERSFHVATQDVEKETVNAKALEFARRVTA